MGRNAAGISPRFPLQLVDAVIFDMDGVVTETVPVHMAAWKRLFNEYLEVRAAAGGEAFRPFDAVDYRRFVDGRPRYDGVRSFLESRGIHLPHGEPTDPPERETVCGLGNRKNAAFLASIAEQGVRAYPTTVEFIRHLRAAGCRVAVISASENASEVLRAAGVRGEFRVKVDGSDAARLGLPGKPDPAVFVEAARRLGVPVGRTAVVEDALAGVEAARRGAFPVVVGVDREGSGSALAASGATLVVRDLGELLAGD